jgi:RNA polymerase sigma-70 factor (ECF subfamily)
VVGNLVGSLQAEDIVQEVFMAAYANLHRFDPCKGSLRTWLLAIARNKAFNATRKKRERTGNNLPQLKDERTPADLLLTKEIFERLDRALDQLKYREKVIFVLAEIEGLSYAEIAAIENLPLGTVKSKLARTRAKLRAMIKEAEEHHEK